MEYNRTEVMSLTKVRYKKTKASVLGILACSPLFDHLPLGSQILFYKGTYGSLSRDSCGEEMKTLANNQRLPTKICVILEMAPSSAGSSEESEARVESLTTTSGKVFSQNVPAKQSPDP